MIIKATFTGTNSLGYEKGKEYVLELIIYKAISVRRLDDTGKCSYQSLSAFFKNWKVNDNVL